MKKGYLLSILLLIIGACSKEKNEPIADTIIGQWEWVKTRGMGKVSSPDQAITTPENTNSTMTYVFSDTELSIFKNNVKSTTLPYSVSNEFYEIRDTLSDFINFNEKEMLETTLSNKMATFFSPHKDTLIIEDYQRMGCGMPIHYFVRVQE